jgi:hypothetical protein
VVEESCGGGGGGGGGGGKSYKRAKSVAGQLEPAWRQ